jgi:hypothetical protein
MRFLRDGARAILCFDSHARTHRNEAGLAIADAVNGDEALEAPPHHAIGRALGVGYRRGAAMIDTGPKKRGRNGVAAECLPYGSRRVPRTCPREYRP